jgi:hypothetical protein
LKDTSAEFLLSGRTASSSLVIFFLGAILYSPELI